MRGARVSEGGMLYRGFGRVEYAHAPIPDAVADLSLLTYLSLN